MIKHFMVDVETLSTKANAVVLSVGAVEFDPETGEIKREFYKELDLRDQTKRHVDVSTVQWWAERCKENVSNLDLLAKSDKEKSSVRAALVMLDAFINEPRGKETELVRPSSSPLDRKEFKVAVWACDPDFDVAILNDMYEGEMLRYPWRYSEPKSVRTIRLLSQIKGIDLPKLEASHNALEDCKRQVAEVSHFLQNVAKVGV